MSAQAIDALVDSAVHPVHDIHYAVQCRDRLEADGALVLSNFVRPDVVQRVIDDSLARVHDVFYADSTHNVWLTDPDPDLGTSHIHNRQVLSTKGLLADDQLPAGSPLRSLYNAAEFLEFIAQVVDVRRVHPYADPLSSINVHFAPEGRELGWHFDNSSFAVTLLLQEPEAGGHFEYVAGARDSAAGDQGLDTVAAVLDGDVAPNVLNFGSGDLVVFRGRDALHRVTPTVGGRTRLLVVFAYNDAPGVSLSPSAMQTFYGRVVD